MFLSKLCDPEPEFRAKRSVSGWLRWNILFLLVETRCLYSLPEELVRCHLLFHSVNYIVHFDIDFSVWNCTILRNVLAEGCTFYFTFPQFFLTMHKCNGCDKCYKKPLDKEKGQKYFLKVFNKFLFCECCVIKGRHLSCPGCRIQKLWDSPCSKSLPSPSPHIIQNLLTASALYVGTECMLALYHLLLCLCNYLYLNCIFCIFEISSFLVTTLQFSF